MEDKNDDEKQIAADETVKEAAADDEYVVYKTIGLIVRNGRVLYCVRVYGYRSRDHTSKPEKYLEPFNRKILQTAGTS